MAGFGAQLIKWYDLNKRDLPWRNTPDPYKIWLSEIILQQTRVEQGRAYYLKFIQQYPDVQKLAQAKQEDVYNLWQGLGYYNRAHNMMQAAKTIANDYKGQLPADYIALQKLSGIGSYTAAAIASIAFGISIPVLDGNVYRVLSRIFAINTPIDTAPGKKMFEQLATSLMENYPPGIFNQALMEFGALHCKPKNPDCSSCIFNQTCLAWKTKTVGSYPVKKIKKLVRKRYFYYLVAETHSGGESYFHFIKRGEKDIWKNLYEFPSVEADKKINTNEALHRLNLMLHLSAEEYQIANIAESFTHQLTHQQIHAVFIRILSHNKDLFEAENSILLVNKKQINNYPVSRLIERYLQDQKLM